MLEQFTLPILGGLLIGAAAVLLLVSLGRIAGVSGILWAALSNRSDNSWRWLFLVGLLLGPVIFHQLLGAPLPAPSTLPWWQAIAGGLLVGFGVKLGSGCTSGHGVCGIGRLSLRSLVATCTFMSAGILTVYALRHAMGAS